MQSVFQLSLIIALLCASVPSAQAQQSGRGKPPPKKEKFEIDDTQKQGAELFEAGQSAHQSGDLNKAIELYSEALKRDPTLWQAEFQRGVAYLSLNRHAEAKASMLRINEQLTQFADSEQLRQISARVQVALGEIALAERNAGEAEKAFRRALELSPGSAPAHSGLAEVLLANGKHDEAIAEAKAGLAAGDNRAATFSLLGIAQTISGKYDEALPNLDEALKRDQKSSIALLYRAEVFIAKNRFNEAIADLRSALAIEPLARTRLRLAAAYMQAKQYAEAIPLYQEVLKDEPSNAEARTALAVAMIESGKGDEAIAQLESLIKAEPNRADLRAQLAELYLPAQPQKALEQYSAAAKLEPSQLNHQIGVGSALVKLRRFQEAVTVLRQALAQNPKDEVAYFAHTNLATALFELDDFPNAAREYIWILNHQRNRGDRKRAAVTLYFLGICLDKLGDYEQAMKAYEQFLSLASSENQLEIDKVKLRLPSLQRQIKEGKGRRKQ
ncbi:MAG: tetratricopeptide repeat protein [Acidobacteria bacterium]|nr:tetratricopeptide repeat protein [Acidobacteriota bacterium]